MIRVMLWLSIAALLLFHEMTVVQREKIAETDHVALRMQLSRLQTDVSDLKQTADALGVACEARR